MEGVSGTGTASRSSGSSDPSKQARPASRRAHNQHADKAMSMSPAELKTLRESLGLTAQWLADQAGVRLRTVQYWEAGRSEPPADVQAILRRIESLHQRAADSASATVMQEIKMHGGDPDAIDLRRFRTDAELWSAHPDYRPLPTTCHAAMLARIATRLRSAGVQSRIEYAGG